jgi:hypothetical protein
MVKIGLVPVGEDGPVMFIVWPPAIAKELEQVNVAVPVVTAMDTDPTEEQVPSPAVHLLMV